MSLPANLQHNEISSQLQQKDPQAFERICKLLGCLPSQLHSFQQLTGGLTNQTYAFCVEGSYDYQGVIDPESKIPMGDRYVYRIPSHLYDGNLISRNSEAEAEKLAHDLGLDPSLIYIDPEEGWKLSHYLPGARPCSYQDFEELKEAIKLLRRIKEHCPQVGHKLKITEHTQNVAQGILTAWNKQLEAGAQESFYLNAADIARLQKSLEFTERFHDEWENMSQLTHLVHLDFWPPNILKWDGGLAIIDWEYCCNAPGILDPASIISPSQELKLDKAHEIFCCYFDKEELDTQDKKQMYIAICLLSAYWLCWSYMREGERDESDRELEDACYFNCVNYGTRALAL